MGVAIGGILGFLSILLLLVPFIIDVYLVGKQTDTSNKRALEAAAVLIAIAGLFMLGGLIFVTIISGWSVGKTGFSQILSGFSGGSTTPEGERYERPGEYTGNGLSSLFSEGGFEEFE